MQCLRLWRILVSWPYEAFRASVREKEGSAFIKSDFDRRIKTDQQPEMCCQHQYLSSLLAVILMLNSLGCLVYRWVALFCLQDHSVAFAVRSGPHFNVPEMDVLWILFFTLLIWASEMLNIILSTAFVCWLEGVFLTDSVNPQSSIADDGKNFLILTNH